MTKDELADFVGLSKASVRKYFNLASKEHPQIAVKINTATGHRAVDYTIEECLFVLRKYSKTTALMEILLEENFIYRDALYKYRERKLKLPADVKHFIFLYEHAVRLKTCANCRFCVGRAAKGARIEPFCDFHESFLSRTRNYNIYKDESKDILLEHLKKHKKLINNLPQNISKISMIHSPIMLMDGDILELSFFLYKSQMDFFNDISSKTLLKVLLLRLFNSFNSLTLILYLLAKRSISS